jgi:glycosyltransferase involved in cell wall biosynthesis
MRIGMIFSTPFPPREGIGFYVWNLAQQLKRQGHDVLLITRGSRRETFSEVLEGIKVWKPLFLPIYPFHVQLHGFFVQRLIRSLESEIDLFHLHSPLPPVISTKRPVLLTFHSTIINGMWLTPVNDLHTLAIKLQSPISYMIERNLIKKATSVNAVSPQTANELKKYPTNNKQLNVMWNGVDTVLFRPKDNGVDKEESIILTVCRLAPGKGLSDLVEAARLVYQKNRLVTFILVGEGPEKNKILRSIKKQGIEKTFKLTGQIGDREELRNLYQQATIFVLASHHEGAPTVLLESMACGCPPIATKVGFIPNIIEQGKNGEIIPIGKPDILTDRILSLLQNKSALKSMGIEARKTVENRFSWETIGKQYEARYRELVDPAS